MPEFFFSMPEDFHNARLMPVFDLNARFFSQCQEGFNKASFVKSGIENANLATLGLNNPAQQQLHKILYRLSGRFYLNKAFRAIGLNTQE